MVFVITQVKLQLTSISYSFIHLENLYSTNFACLIPVFSNYESPFPHRCMKAGPFTKAYKAWWLSGRIGAFRSEGRGFESRSGCSVETLSKFLIHNALH